MAAEASRSVIAGAPSKTSSPIWVNDRRDAPLTESTTTAITSPETVDGPRRGSRRTTAGECVVPWRGGCEHRERARDWLLERLPYPATLAPGPEPWCKAAAVNPAVEASAAEIVVVTDADVWAEGLEDAIDAVRAGAPWAMPHRGVFRLTEASTAAFMAGADPYDLPLEQPAYLGLEGGGVVVARRETLCAVPLDPRFIGWGGEDVSWGRALRALEGPPWRAKRPLIHLWHPPQQRMTRKHGSVAGRALARRYRAAAADPDRMRRLIEEGRA